jgi:adenylate cyclase
MTSSSFRPHRKLTAILAADLAGYSALMGADEDATVRDLKAHQAIILPMIAGHGGRIVDTAGDGILAEFASVVNAIECAVALQKTMAERNRESPADRHMLFRIGINLGDVIYDDARVYGDGVNIAARLETLAQPGGICVSGAAFDQVHTKLPYTFSPLGKQHLKNIAAPIPVYRVELGQIRQPIDKAPLALPDKPSIAVLPFDNMSGNIEEEYFSDGITEDIITELSRFSELFVIARNSSFQYKGKSPDIRQVGRELCVRYVLEGSIRRVKDRVRVTAQLVTTTDGTHLWAERYDRVLEDIFAIQDEVVLAIVPLLAAHVARAERQLAISKPPTSLLAYDYFLHAAATYTTVHHHFEIEKIQQARDLLGRCLEVDPDFARAHVLLSTTRTTTYATRMQGGSSDLWNPAALDAAYQSASKAVQLAPNLPEARAQLGYVYTFQRKHDLAVREFERAFALNHNFTDWRFCPTLLWSGMPDRAIEVAHRHLRFDPFALPIARGYLGYALLTAGRYEEALPALLEFLGNAPGHAGGHLWLIACYVHLGRLEDAAAVAAKVRQRWPELSIASPGPRNFPYRDPGAHHCFLEALRKGGVPEN